jgi:DNA-binding transcriptional MerR regulator
MTVSTQPRESARQPPRLQTIGAVRRRLKAEFPDISISKIRYLEDQGLLSPRRTPGGYRLFSDDDVERLETILRLQRDEFLPLRVIRQELTSPVPKGRRRRRSLDAGAEETALGLAELCEKADITPDFARDLEEYGLIAPMNKRGERRYAEGEADVAAVCARLAAFGISARHLRTFLTTADRAAALLGQVAAPSLHSRNLERRQAGLQELQALGELAQELSQLLFWRDLRRLAAS